MRLAIFTLQNEGKKIALHPDKITIMADQNPYGHGVTTIEYNSRSADPIEVQGTFEEAVDEVNSALNEVIVKMKGKLFRDGTPAEKTGKCWDCDAPVYEWQERCPVCYQKEMDKPINADEEKP